jgi:hypothetical protein
VVHLAYLDKMHNADVWMHESAIDDTSQENKQDKHKVKIAWHLS